MSLGPSVVILYAYAALFIGLSALAACRALFADDPMRRQDAYRVLKLTLVTGTGAGGVLAVTLQLHQAGLV